MANRLRIGVSTAFRLLAYEGLEVEKRWVDWAAFADNVRAHPEIWNQRTEADRAKIRAEMDAYVVTRMVAENALNREDEDLDE